MKLLLFWICLIPELTLIMQAQSLADPFAYDTYIEKRKQEKVAAELASRITVRSFACIMSLMLILFIPLVAKDVNFCFHIDQKEAAQS